MVRYGVGGFTRKNLNAFRISKVMSSHKTQKEAKVQCKILQKKGKEVAVFQRYPPFGWIFITDCK